MYVASRISHLVNFHLPYIQYMKKQSYTLHIMAQGYKDLDVDNIYYISFEKKITSLKNIKTIFEIKNILEKEKYELIIVNTTLASFLVRIAKILSSVKNYGKLVNIVHGYLFSEKSNMIKKSIYLLAEKMCVNCTDKILVMNNEDYKIATEYKLCNGEVVQISGMGVPDIRSFDESVKDKVRQRYLIKCDDILMCYVGELSDRKNQIFLINSMPDILEKISKIKLILVGDGTNYNLYKNEISRLNLEDKVILAGYQKNPKEIMYASDIVISSSKSEGLPFNIMEAMIIGTPVVASDVKGHIDLIQDGKTGYVYASEDKKCLIEKISELLSNKNIDLVKDSAKQYIKKYELENVFYDNIESIL